MTTPVRGYTRSTSAAAHRVVCRSVSSITRRWPQARRGARRLRVLPHGETLLALRGGGVGSGDFVAINLLSGEHRKVTNFGHEFTVDDFDVSADGREIVFDRVAENSDIVLIER